jgi:hypothetical protein
MKALGNVLKVLGLVVVIVILGIVATHLKGCSSNVLSNTLSTSLNSGRLGE